MVIRVAPHENDDTTPAGQGLPFPCHTQGHRSEGLLRRRIPPGQCYRAPPRPNMFPTRCYWPALFKYSCPWMGACFIASHRGSCIGATPDTRDEGLVASESEMTVDRGYIPFGRAHRESERQ